MEIWLLSLFLLYAVPRSLSFRIAGTFRDRCADDCRNIHQIAINRQTGEVIVGGENVVYKLNQDLDMIQKLQTGPVEDNLACWPPNLPCDKPKRNITNFLKGMVFDYREQSLILCLSAYHGSCMIVDANNITNIKNYVKRSVVTINPTDPDFLFVGKGVDSKDVLYVGSTFDNIFVSTEYSNQINHVSSRDLTNLDFSYSDAIGGTKISVLPEKKNSEKSTAKFLYGFDHGNFTYFIATRNDRHSTWIIRLCQNDKYFNSYVEIPLSCYADKFNTYNEAQGAFYEGDSKKLYVVFKKNGTNSGALCAFKMEESERLFNVAVENCYNGEGYLGPDYVRLREKCPKTVSGSSWKMVLKR